MFRSENVTCHDVVGKAGDGILRVGLVRTVHWRRFFLVCACFEALCASSDRVAQLACASRLSWFVKIPRALRNTRGERKNASSSTASSLLRRAHRPSWLPVHPSSHSWSPSHVDSSHRLKVVSYFQLQPRCRRHAPRLDDASMARSSSSNGHLDKHLKDPFTTRDLLGVCRGRCVSKTCPGCPGGYLKCTADYYAKPPPWTRARSRRKVPP
jgi:hypothetical protein